MRDHLISQHASAIEALKQLNGLSGGVMTLFALDDEGRAVGALTDGDIRRALVGGASLETPVSEIMHRQFRSVRGDTADPRVLREYRRQGMRLVPWLNDDGTPRRLIDLERNHTMLPLSAVLMAGGKGERLRPLTLDTPKPLLELGGKAIIDYNIDALRSCGVSDIYVTIRYLADKMRRHFEGTGIRCVEEDEPLGTIGSASLCGLADDGATIVMNSDLITNISFEDMYLHHIDERADITVAVIPYQVSVPFAIVSTDLGDPSRVTAIEEKPSYSYYANAGIYIIANRLLNRLPAHTRTDATDLIEQAIDRGLRVTQFPINGTWIDVGSPADFNQAAELLRYAGSGTPASKP